MDIPALWSEASLQRCSEEKVFCFATSLNRSSGCVFSYKFAAYFRTYFPKNTYRGLLLHIALYSRWKNFPCTFSSDLLIVHNLLLHFIYIFTTYFSLLTTLYRFFIPLLFLLISFNLSSEFHTVKTKYLWWSFLQKPVKKPLIK